MNIEYFDIGLIQGNPYQPRELLDVEHIRRLADSIRADGLLQIPVGRYPVDPAFAAHEVELAFGHSRLAAFKLLAAEDQAYCTMPVDIQDLDEEAMFRTAITENLQRRDLTPIEQAKAMLVYRQVFGKTSAEIGALFGIHESAVRNKMRLVELPEMAQQALEEGKLTEGGARKLLSLKGVVKDELVDAITAHVITTSYDKPSQMTAYVMDSALQDARAKQLHAAYELKNSDNPVVGSSDGFRLDWRPTATLAMPTWGEFSKFYNLPEDAEGKQHTKYAFETVTRDWGGNYLTAEQFAIRDAIEAMIHPPACSACGFYLVMEGTGVCGRKICWERKREEWKRSELIRISQETGIAIYDASKDGEVYLDRPVERFERDDPHPWEADRAAGHLRLVSDKFWNRDLITGSDSVRAVNVNPVVVAELKKERENTDGLSAHERWQVENERRRVIRQEMADWVDAEAAPLFGQAFWGDITGDRLRVMHEVLADDTHVTPVSDAELQCELGRKLIFITTNSLYNHQGEGLAGLKQELAEMLVDAGMNRWVPGDWLQEDGKKDHLAQLEEVADADPA